jgi:hypothetical protein
MGIVPPLSASGRFIVDAAGSRVRLAGVNWYGAHEDHGVVSGLERTDRNTLARRIALLGFNSVRLPFSLWMTQQDTPVADQYLAANPDLAGATPIQVYDACVKALTDAGLAVIPNCHMLDPGWPVPESTQILTRSGWKHVTEVRPGEHETLGYQDGELLWTPITHVRRRGSQRVVRFGSARWSTVCTPEHRWLTSTAFPRNRKPVEWGPVRGESAVQAWFSKLTPRGIAGARKLVLTGYAEGGKNECSPDEARVAAWLLSDGSVTWRRDNNGVVAYIAQSEGKHVNEIRELLAREQACSSEIIDTHSGYRVSPVRRFRIRAAYVRRLWDDYGLKGGLLPFVISLSREARSAWLDAWRKAEGSRGEVYQNPGSKLDAIALTAFLEGYLPQPIVSKRHSGVSLVSGYQIENGPNCKSIFEDAGYTDVWCPTTELGSWVARDADGHIFVTGNCCSEEDASGLWFNDRWPAQRFFAIWRDLAARYRDNPLVAGLDILNEPRRTRMGWRVLTPTWGSRHKTDLAAMYTEAGNVIHEVSPDVLIICEGLGYAADLSGAASHPLQLDRPGKVVYSLHDYSWFHPGNQSRRAYLGQMHHNGGYLLRDGIAPLWLGEFGNDPRSLANFVPAPGGPAAAVWWANLQAWVTENDVDWCWWPLNPTQPQGTIPVTGRHRANWGDPEHWGLLTPDWRTVANPAVLEILREMIPPRTGPGVPGG